jgi:hypothetical protein
MQLVRGPTWIPVKIALWFQLACILAAMLAMSCWSIIIASAYLIDPEVGATRVVAMSLVGLVIPFGTVAHFLAVPVVVWGRRLPLSLRWLLAVAPWLAVSHWLMSRLPWVFHRSPADILPGRFNWLWLSVTILAALLGPASAEQWYFRRKVLNRRLAANRAQIASIQENIAEQRAQREKKDAEFAAKQEAFAGAQEAYEEARAKMGNLRGRCQFASDRSRLVEATRTFGQILQSNPGISVECCRKREDAIREFIRDTDWHLSGDISNDRSDPLPGHISGSSGD